MIGRDQILGFLWLAGMLIFPSCETGKSKARDASEDTLSSGEIHISVDESFQPIIDSQIQVFHSQFPKARIIPHYKPENECLKDLQYDSIRMVIVTRGLSEGEVNFYKDTLGYAPIWDKLASDAMTVIVNRESKDSLFDDSDIRSILDGSSFYKYKPVFDGLSATSTVRYAMDSILRGKKLAAGVQAATSSQSVIDYVAANKDAMGFIGVSWIGNKDDAQQTSFLSKVRIASIECVRCEEEGIYVKPYQANIATKRYPYIRGVYYILKENYSGLGRGFVNFMQYEKGQLIFKRAYLWPSKMTFTIRNAQLRDK